MSIHIFTSTIHISNVGTPLHRGVDEFIAFHNAFIKPTNINFITHFDIVVNTPSKKVVARYIHIQVTITSCNVTTAQPAIVLYEVDCYGKIESLQAHWNFMDRVEAVLSEKNGFKAMTEMLEVMVKNFHIAGAVEYGLGGFLHEGKVSTNEVKNFMDLNNWGQLAALHNISVEIYTNNEFITFTGEIAIIDLSQRLKLHISSLELGGSDIVTCGDRVASVMKIEWKRAPASQTRSEEGLVVASFNLLGVLEDISFYFNAFDILKTAETVIA
jgi:hypothetical protein